jgi:hypothetical protein
VIVPIAIEERAADSSTPHPEQMGTPKPHLPCQVRDTIWRFCYGIHTEVLYRLDQSIQSFTKSKPLAT